MKILHVDAQATRKRLRALLANASIVIVDEEVVKLPFQLKGHISLHKFYILKMGQFEGILGKDWLSKNLADIHCSQGIISFVRDAREQVQVQGRAGEALLKVVKIKQLVKVLKKGLPIYVLKINKP